VVTLGTFQPQAHRDWLRENKAKAPKPLGELEIDVQSAA
jgi:hypothetical protein